MTRSLDRLRVGIVAPPWVAVPPPVYGGTEVVIDQLARGLVRAGHEVVLFTTGDSTCPVERRWFHRHALGTTAPSELEEPHVVRAHAVLQDLGVDVVHDHTIAGPRRVRHGALGVPVVTTNHGPFIGPMTEHFAGLAGHVSVIAISHHQRSTAPHVPVAAVIHHGLDVAEFPLGTGDGGYLLFLGRMNPEKGAHRAIAVARSAGTRILLAAKMWEPEEREYFRRSVEPLLGEDAVYVGEVGGAEKLRLLAGAAALVNPIRWPEPFGMVMLEALACGTPVLSFAAGAAPEIVEHGRTGFLCRDEEEMAAFVDEVRRIDRRECRERVRTCFSTEKMVDAHVALYRRIIDARTALVA